MFSTFPDGSPGFGLLILRVALGITTFFRGALYLSQTGEPAFSSWLIGLSATAAGAFLLIGFLTPVVGALVFAGSLVLLAASRTTIAAAEIYALVLAAALALLGPGAFSLDARFFGRREIVIPKKSPVSDD